MSMQRLTPTPMAKTRRRWRHECIISSSDDTDQRQSFFPIGAFTLSNGLETMVLQEN